MRKVVLVITVVIVMIFGVFLLFNTKHIPIYLNDIISDKEIEYESINVVEIFDRNGAFIEGKDSWLNAVVEVALITPLTEISPNTKLADNYYKVFMYTHDYTITIEVYEGYFKYSDKIYKADDIAYDTITNMIARNE